MLTTPLAEQLKIVLIGLRNSGKSSLINNIFEKEVAIVSETPGTTTDPVTRSIELSELGPVAITDTAGIDDVGELGILRIKKSFERINIADIVIFVTRNDMEVNDKEKEIVEELKRLNKPIIFALTFSDKETNKNKLEWCKNFGYVLIDNTTKKGIFELKKELIKLAEKITPELTPVEGLVNENDFVILVVPIDLAAPKGRLILPQVETIRDLLDKDCAALIVKERELKYFYDVLKIKPKLVITDSQAFHKVAADIPEDQPLTSFSILFARKKGDLAYYVKGIKNINKIPKDGKILILESCSHHRAPDDIGTVKIPRLIRQLISNEVVIDFARELPSEDKLKEYYIVINCAGCMVTRQKIMYRISILKKHNIYATNYGLFLAWANGLLPRALEPFKYEYEIYKNA